MITPIDHLGQTLRDARDRFVASDPGWARLRLGAGAAVAVGTALLIEIALSALFGRPALLAMLLGAVVAMLMSTGIREMRRSVIVRTGSAAPFVAAGGVTVGVVTAERPILGLIAFVVVSFTAVWVRRFGPRWFTLGFLFWQGFFFALFLRPPLAELPFLLLAVLVSGGWVLLLLLTALYDRPDARLRRIVTAFRARARSGIAATLGVLDDPGSRRAGRAVRRELVKLSEVALLLDGQLSDRRSLPPGLSPSRMRRWTVDVEIGMDEVCSAAMALAAKKSDLGHAQLAAVRTLLTELGWGRPEIAAELAASVAQWRDNESTKDISTAGFSSLDAAAAGMVPPIRRLGVASGALLDTIRIWDTADWIGTPGPENADSDDSGEDFEPVITLISGNLPGTAVLADRANSRQDAGRFSLSRLALTTRQAIQAGVAAGLAILVGELISRQRFYWAVIAAFLCFAGTATSGETLARGISRITGTVAGLFAAVALANLTDGHPAVAVILIVLCIGFAFFAQPVSYGTMIFFITLMLGQLYTLLGTFSDDLLLVRLSETVAGALIGILVSQLVLPTRTRAATRAARKDFFSCMADVLDACAEVLGGGRPAQDLLRLAVLLDAADRQVSRTYRTSLRGQVFIADRAALRHRVAALHSCAASARSLAGAVSADHPDPLLRNVCEQLSARARELAAAVQIGSVGPRMDLTDQPAGSARELLGQLDRRPVTSGSGSAVGGLAEGPGVGSTAGPPPELPALRQLADALALFTIGPAAT